MYKRIKLKVLIQLYDIEFGDIHYLVNTFLVTTEN